MNTPTDPSNKILTVYSKNMMPLIAAEKLRNNLKTERKNRDKIFQINFAIKDKTIHTCSVRHDIL